MSILNRLHKLLGKAAGSVVVRLKQPASIGVKVMAFNDAGEVLLVRHSYRPGFMLPGGGVDAGETVRQGALREMEEEAGVTVSGNIRLFHAYLNREQGPRNHVVMFVMEGCARTRAWTPGLEIREAGFYALDALPETTTEATHRRLSEVLKGQPPSDFW
ncbi:MAG: NUDIX domain-containing protein [Pseudomonadota bacterium]